LDDPPYSEGHLLRFQQVAPDLSDPNPIANKRYQFFTRNTVVVPNPQSLDFSGIDQRIGFISADAKRVGNIADFQYQRHGVETIVEHNIDLPNQSL